MTEEPKEIEILHFSAIPRGRRVPFLIVNCVFRASGGSRYQAEFGAEEWQKVRVTEDKDLFEKRFFDELDVDDPIDHFSKVYDELMQSRWTQNYVKWSYIPKFDCFRFHEYVTATPTSSGAVEEIQHFKEHGRFATNIRSTDGCHFMRLLEVLDSLWD